MPYGAEIRSGLKILFLDDDLAFGALVRKGLIRRGHEVEIVLTGAEALERIARGGVDVVTLDHSLAGETGFDILGRLGPRGARPPVVYVTADADARTAVAALRAGADEYVVKDAGPEFFELLISAIEQVYERWRLKKLRAEQERAVREARDRAESLLHEVNHRIANSLGLVAAMVRMQASALSDPVAVQALQETQARITAIGGVHRRLYMHSKIGLVALDDYLQFLTEELQGTLRDQEHPVDIKLMAEPIVVSTDKAIPIGVIVGELTTNAYKYAYPAGVQGDIRITLRQVEPGRAELLIADDGAGYDADASARGTGLGSKILKAMAVNLRGEIVKRDVARGATVGVVFPCDPETAEQDAEPTRDHAHDHDAGAELGPVSWPHDH
jgi:two-component sensor histidine kinase